MYALPRLCVPSARPALIAGMRRAAGSGINDLILIAIFIFAWPLLSSLATI